MQESDSFLTDIKNLEQQLVKSPDSLCFAKLSEVFLKAGLIDDALQVARQGVKKHPRYLSGQRALSLASYAKGLNDEALAALKLLTEALPEDISSQKLLGQLLVEAGDLDAARQVLHAALEFSPDDVELRVELESLEQSVEMTKSTFEDDEEIIEDLEVWEGDELGYESQALKATSSQNGLLGSGSDPLSTSTLAELYVKQGFIDKALGIYQVILADNPDDRLIAERVAALEALEAHQAKPDSAVEGSFEEDPDDEPLSSIPFESLFKKAAPAPLPEYNETSSLEARQNFAYSSDGMVDAPVVPSQATADSALSTLYGWLDNIRRIKSCH